MSNLTKRQRTEIDNLLRSSTKKLQRLKAKSKTINTVVSEVPVPAPVVETIDNTEII